MILYALIHSDRDKYLSLLIQNGAKLLEDFDVTKILPLGKILGQDNSQTPPLTQIQAMTSNFPQNVPIQTNVNTNENFQTSVSSSVINASIPSQSIPIITSISTPIQT